MARINEILWSPHEFLQKIFQWLSEDAIDVSGCELDHICYRTETVERYQFLKNQIESGYGELLDESIIGWRPIATYRLNDPVIFVNRKIQLLELPSPKATSFYPEWYEHVEFVIDESFSDFCSRYSWVSFDTKSQLKEINPDISRKYSFGSVKFHHASLDQVSEMEQVIKMN